MIRQKISNILDLPIREGRWESYTDALNREGKPDRITLVRMVMALCEVVEELEATIQRLEYEPEAEKLPDAPETAGVVLARYFTCDVCGKEVSTALALSGHKRSHNGKTS